MWAILHHIRCNLKFIFACCRRARCCFFPSFIGVMPLPLLLLLPRMCFAARIRVRARKNRLKQWNETYLEERKNNESCSTSTSTCCCYCFLYFFCFVLSLFLLQLTRTQSQYRPRARLYWWIHLIYADSSCAHKQKHRALSSSAIQTITSIPKQNRHSTHISIHHGGTDGTTTAAAAAAATTAITISRNKNKFKTIKLKAVSIHTRRLLSVVLFSGWIFSHAVRR